MTAAGSPQLAYLRAAGACVVLDVTGPALPRVLHWGADLGDLDADGLQALAAASVPATPRSALDRGLRVPLLPTERDGWSGTPGLSGHRAGADPVPALALAAPVQVDAEHAGGRVRAVAAGGGLRVTVFLALDARGIVRVQVEVTNTGTGAYDLAGVLPLLPVPPDADELFDLTGRWCRERAPQRAPLQHGTHLRTGRRGRSGHDAVFLLAAGTRRFGFRTGEVWATHLAWSGDTLSLVERLPEGAGAGATLLGAGELLRPGEMRLQPGDTYTSPAALYVWSGHGLDGVSARVHRALRDRPQHPRTPRPVVLNTWEAVYFDHDPDRLRRLADVAASLGVERFVLDDGWFGARRNDAVGLGDWWVSPDVWPQGLRPLADHVHGLGMQFGLWVEPEMANPDSALVRAHPDWLLTPDAPLWRHQRVVDLANPEAYAYLLAAIGDVVADAEVDFLKWDHNRDLHIALHTRADGARVPGVHAQTTALYRLLDELRSRRPGLEIESCAGGGGRVDLGILEHADRVWASDSNDALERQLIQRFTGLLLPPELVGAHVGPPRNPTSHRTLDLAFRCVTALFGHAGIEWDVTTCTPDELAVLRRWIAMYKELRPLLHGGDTVRADLGDDAALLHGVVAPDRAHALFAYVRLASGPDATPGRVRLPGLDAATRYSVRVRDDLGRPATVQDAPPPWTTTPSVLSGAVLGRVGLPMPVLAPAAALLLEVRHVG